MGAVPTVLEVAGLQFLVGATFWRKTPENGDPEIPASERDLQN